jgi:hypothetical protein
MKSCRVSHGRGDLWLMAGTPPPTSSLRLYGDVSLRTVGPPQLPQGGLTHLQLPAKHDRYSFHVSEGIGNPEILPRERGYWKS